MLAVVIGIALLLLVVLVVVVALMARGAGRGGAALEEVARGIAKLRRMAGVAPRYAPLPGDAQEAPGLERAEPDLERSGLVPVGDLHELGEDGRPAAAVRWFVSRQGGVWGWLGVSPAGPAMLLVSQVPGAGFVTTLRSPPAPNTAIPDSVVHQRLDWEEGLASALGRHATAVAAMGEPTGVKGLEGALEGMAALKAHVAAWRGAQDPDELLRADVKRILGDRFEDLGEAMVMLVRMEEGTAGSPPPG